jgi:hypothetical protein
MKYLLNEEVKKMQRLAGIPQNNYDFKEFLQVLYEIHLNLERNKNILNEASILQNVKSNFAKFAKSSKQKIKGAFDSIKQYANPAEVIKDFGQAVKDIDPKHLRALMLIASNPKTNLKEAETKVISKESDLSKLKAGDVFTWEGESLSDFENNYVSNYKSKDQGLVKGFTYVVYEEPDESLSFIQDKEVNYIKDTNGESITKLNKFYEKYPWVKKIVAALILLSLGITGNAGVIKQMYPDDVQLDASKVSQTGEAEYPYQSDVDAGGSNIQSVDLGVGQIDNSDLDNFKTQAKKLMPDENVDDISTAATFKVGEYKLTPDQEKWVIKKGVEDVLKQIENQASTKGIKNTITVKGSVVGNISSNPGDNDDIANDGSKNLKGLRADYGEKLNKEIQKQVNDIVKSKLGNNIKVNFDMEKSTGDIDNQVQHNPVNYSADQSTIIDYDVDTDGGSKMSLKLYNPLAAVTGKGGSDMGQRIDIKNPKGTDPGKEEKPIPTGDSDPEDAEKLVKNKSLNRNQEIFSVLKMANPNIKGDPNDRTYKSWDDSTKKIVINLRKSPDTLLKKFQSVTGINLTSRQKSTGAFKRSGLAESIMLEAAIDNALTSIGISDEAIRKNKVEVMAMLMKMYNLSYTDIPKEELQKLTPEENKTLVNIIKPIPVRNTSKIASDVTTINKDINSNNSLKTALSRINNEEELADLLVASVKYVNKDFQKSTEDNAAFNDVAKEVPKFYTTSTSSTPKTFNYSVVKEEEKVEQDVINVEKIINNYSTLKNHLERINYREELKQFILNVIFPSIDPKLAQSQSRISTAIQKARNILAK